MKLQSSKKKAILGNMYASYLNLDIRGTAALLQTARGRLMWLVGLNSLLAATSLKTRRSLSSCIVFNERLYIAGGEMGGESGGCNKVEVLSLHNYSWEELSPTPSYRSSLGILCNALISVGGTVSHERSEASKKVAVFDSNNNSWRPLPLLIEARDLPGLVTIDFRNLLAIGGMPSYGSVDRLATVERLEFPASFAEEGNKSK
eukprot:m.19758 g.19758  ORF g.19758 m.19758 type:complete len:203 (+) comp27895_c0_seq1:723-1331(+)